jgi:three-Cys-motif partner protein
MMGKDTWGGNWTEQKLDAFSKYVNSYLTIMNKHRDKYGWKLIYFDAFAGSGKRTSPDKVQENTSLFDITLEEEGVYQGAAERVLKIEQRGFDYYYFIENDEESIAELEKRLLPIKEKKGILELRFRPGDANAYLKELADTMKKNKTFRSLALLDPFGMQVNWDSIKQLEGTKTDLWILIPSGIIINRLLDRSGKLVNINKLIAFFGLPEQEIRDSFYKQDESNDLFGNSGEIYKETAPIQRISELYIKQLEAIFKYVTPKPLELRNSRNVPIYHFAFASNNETARKIASQIIGRKSK